MGTRNLKQQLQYSYYEDMEDGRTIETIDYDCLIGILTELLERVEALENDKKQWCHPESGVAITQDYRNNLGL